MSRNPFNTALRTYVAETLAQPGEHSRSELAQSFLAQHPDLAGVRLVTLAQAQVDILIREMCDADSGDEQMAFFDGLPAAIAVAPGTVKAIEFCTPEDLEVGEQHRRDNITSAQDKLRRFQTGVRKYLKARMSGETVGDTARRLAERRQAS